MSRRLQVLSPKQEAQMMIEEIIIQFRDILQMGNQRFSIEGNWTANNQRIQITEIDLYSDTEIGDFRAAVFRELFSSLAGNLREYLFNLNEYLEEFRLKLMHWKDSNQWLLLQDFDTDEPFSNMEDILMRFVHYTRNSREIRYSVFQQNFHDPFIAQIHNLETLLDIEVRHHLRPQLQNAVMPSNRLAYGLYGL